MGYDIPRVKACCGCVPLRRGLLVWAYIRLILDIAILIVFPCMSGISSYPDNYDSPFLLKELYLACFATVILMLEIVFNIVLLYGAHTKNYSVLRTYYRYAIFILAIQFICHIIIVGVEIYLWVDKNVWAFAFFLLLFLFSSCILSVQTVMQVYLIVVVRSEALKLKDNEELRAINMKRNMDCSPQSV